MDEIEFVAAAAVTAPGNLSVAAESLLLSTSVCNVPRLLAGALSGALTGVFAVVGAFTGAVTGALAGHATESGLLRGAGLGAVAGAVLSVEVLEASRAYWYSEHAGSRLSFSVTEFIEDFLNGRFVQEQVGSTILNAHRWQGETFRIETPHFDMKCLWAEMFLGDAALYAGPMFHAVYFRPCCSLLEKVETSFFVNISEMSYEELYDMFGPGEGHEGASKACIENLPSHFVTDQNRMDSSGDTICCTICLQDLLQGEVARCLPLCQHTFHMPCVDKWLVQQGSCPICRRRVRNPLQQLDSDQ